ncbi:MAG: hypothetical protein Q9191_000430 [Dirinaria sp. TL-2023a]
MDQQGTPIGSTNQGMKNTSDPESYLNPKEEGPGAIASDSLAAESTKSGGAFSNNRNAEPQSVSGSSSTFNNTDTSGATTLAPAPDAAEREAKQAWQETSDEAKGPGGQKYPEGLGGQGTFDGQHNLDGYSGGSTSAKQELADNSGVYQASGLRGGGPGADDSREDYNVGGSGGNPDSSNFNTAPSYVGSVQSQPGQEGKPKGKNITEGGFDEDPSKNASFNSDIGTDDDPGRRAENEMQRATQAAAGSTAPRQKKGNSDNSQYDVLETEQNL